MCTTRRDQVQAYISDPSSSDSRRGLKRSWKETSSGLVAGCSTDTPGKLTSAEKGKKNSWLNPGGRTVKE